MRIVAISDLHEEELVLDRLKTIEKDKNFDYLIIAGDIGNNISYAEEIVSILKEAFYVPGNSEGEQVRRIMEEAGFSIHGKTIELKEGYKLAGFGYSNITPFGTPGEMSEDEMKKNLRNLEVDENTIFVSHCPPYGILDNVKGTNIGCKAIRELIEEKKPFLHLFGHVHEIIGKEVLGKTLCVNLPPAYSLKAAHIEIKEKDVDITFGKF